MVAPYRGAVTTTTWPAEPALARAGSTADAVGEEVEVDGTEVMGGAVVLGVGATVVGGMDVVGGGSVPVRAGWPAVRGPAEPHAARTSTDRRATAARPHERPTTHYFTKW